MARFFNNISSEAEKAAFRGFKEGFEAARTATASFFYRWLDPAMSAPMVAALNATLTSKFDETHKSLRWLRFVYPKDEKGCETFCLHELNFDILLFLPIRAKTIAFVYPSLAACLPARLPTTSARSSRGHVIADNKVAYLSVRNLPLIWLKLKPKFRKGVFTRTRPEDGNESGIRRSTKIDKLCASNTFDACASRLECSTSIRDTGECPQQSVSVHGRSWRKQDWNN